MTTRDGIKVTAAKTREVWRKWLEKYGETEPAVWLKIYHKDSGVPSVGYAESIEESLCFGWIDAVANKGEGDHFFLYFAPRKAKGNWSKVNKERIARMTKLGLMHPTGQAAIDLAKKNGSWDRMNDVDNEVIPEEMQQLFDKNKTAFSNFQGFAPSSRRLILQWITTAKRPETRMKRVEETVALAAQGIRAHHPAKK